MNIMLKVIGCICLMLIFTDVSWAKEWRSIIPLHSTRADVERLLGPPDDKSISTYYLPEENVSFQYAQKQCDQGWNVALDTVIYISINPKVRKPLSELNFDLTKYKKKPGDYDVPDHFYYMDEEDGFAFSVRGEIVGRYIYGPTAKDSSLRCPKATRPNNSFNASAS